MPKSTFLSSALLFFRLLLGIAMYLLSLSVIYMTGWREHESQQKAKRRGSATVSFKDIQNEFGGGGAHTT